jgi:hypothetical protein
MRFKLVYCLFLLSISIVSCSVDCDQYPVYERYRGHYEFTKDNGLHYVGLDDKYKAIDIVIPKKNYVVVDGEPKCFCSYNEK